MATTGLMTWFTALTVVVRFIPNRIGPNFFRDVNAIFSPYPPSALLRSVQ